MSSEKVISDKTAEFIKKATLKHGGKYTYGNTEYFKNYIHVSITCPLHGDWEQTPNNHLRGKGCPSCAGLKPLTIETFIERSKKLHGDKYDYSKVVYVGLKIKVKIGCPIHGEFMQRPNNHLGGHGCMECSNANKTGRPRKS